MAFVSDMAGLGLFTADLATETPKPLLLTGEPDTPSFPDGSGLVFSMDSTSTRIVRSRLADGRRDTLATRGLAPRPLQGGVAYLPHSSRGNRIVVQRESRVDTLHLPVDFVADFAFSPDERHLVVAVPTPGEPEGTEVRVTNDDAVESELRWTPDGLSLVFAVRSPNRGIWLLPLDGGKDR